MGNITFVVGGARSGKSSYALTEAKKYGKRVAFVATAAAGDDEMRTRIRMHKKVRPLHWKTFEETKNLNSTLQSLGGRFDSVLIDCLSLWVSNLLLEGKSAAAIKKEMRRVLKTLRAASYRSLLVSNEVGLGIVPDNALGRQFRDIAGAVNQLAAQKADEVFFMISGVPLKIK